MRVKIDTSGLDKLRQNLEKLSGNQQVAASDLFGAEFMRSHTEFSSWDEMAEAYGLNEPEDVNTAEFDAFVRERTEFEDFDAMKSSGGADYARRKLFE